MIFVVEDEQSIRELIVYTLKVSGFEALALKNHDELFSALKEETPELIRLDIMLPGKSGMEILKELKESDEYKDIPVIMETAKGSEFDRVIGLDSGADDYISKPFGMMELVARVRAVLRRTEPSRESTEYRVGELYVCPDRHETRIDGRQIQLTYKEFLLLCTLLENQGRVLTREVLMDKVWGLSAERENRTLDVHIRTLRQKLGPVGSRIQTVRGVGYRLEEREG